MTDSQFKQIQLGSLGGVTDRQLTVIDEVLGFQESTNKESRSSSSPVKEVATKWASLAPPMLIVGSTAAVNRFKSTWMSPMT